MNILERRAWLNVAIAEEAARRSKRPGDTEAKRAAWHREMAEFLRNQATRRPDRSKATW